VIGCDKGDKGDKVTFVVLYKVKWQPKAYILHKIN